MLRDMAWSVRCHNTACANLQGAADSAEAAAVTIRLVDFAHTFPSPGGRRDSNFHAGIKAFSVHLSDVLALDHQDCLL